MKNITRETKKNENQTDFEKKLKEAVTDMWVTFNKSKENRQFVLDGFDKIKEQFADNPNIVEYFENIRKAFLESEVKIRSKN
jgi:hypothetical protein